MSESPIPLSEPLIGGNARKYLEECLATNFVSSVGPFVDRFEREFAAWVGSRYAVACASGTAALHVAMRLFDIREGDEVVVPSLTFIASANPVMYERASLVLVDSERETWNFDERLIVDELERRARAGHKQPKAVEAVHILGHPAKMDLLADACARYGVILFEDASEALGARWKSGPFAGRHVGTIGRLGCFSFNGNKIMTTGNGGMITTDDPELARRAKHLTTQARLPGVEYRHDEVGYNYRLSNLSAAIGVAQLEQLETFIAKKLEIAERYEAGLRGVPGITPAPHAAWAKPSMWLYTISVDAEQYGMDSRALLTRLATHGIATRPIWSPLHQMPMFSAAPRLGSAVAESLFSTGLSLPCSVGLEPQAQARVIERIRAR